MDRLWPLWEAMAGTWSSFISLYGDEPNAAWIVSLKDFTDEQIFSGYEAAKLAGTEFPPNLAVFVQHCSGNNDWEQRRMHRAWNPEESLPDLGEGRLIEHQYEEKPPEEWISGIRDLLSN